jgi:hypothetical protein
MWVVADNFQFDICNKMKHFCSLSQASNNQIILNLFSFIQNLLHSLKSFIFCDPNGHVIVFLIDIFIDFVLDYYLIFPVSEVQEDAVFVSALRPADEVLAILYGAEEDLHSLVEVEESLGGNELTMNAEAADCGEA